MKKKIAVAVDGSVPAGQAVAYAATMAALIKDLDFVLIHIQPTISNYLVEEAQRSAGAARQLKALIEKNSTAGQTLLDKYRKQMVTAGVAAERIQASTRPRHVGVADDLLAWGQAGAYDALLVGRRGVSYLQELVMGSVTANLVNNSQLTPIWLVDGDVRCDKILLAVDGSTMALRAVDHLGFMLSGCADSRIDMVHVQPRLQDYCEINLSSEPRAEAESILLDSDRRCLDDFYVQALTLLKRQGFDEARISLKIVANKLLTGKAILEEARRGGYGTVVIGKRGTSKSLFFGSVSQYVIQKMDGMAVWIVP